MIRDVIRCKITFGVQAALTFHIPIVAILSDGLVLEFEDEEQQQKWQKFYGELYHSKVLRWGESEWYERGYKLQTKTFTAYWQWKKDDSPIKGSRMYTISRIVPIPLKESEKIT